MRLDLDDIRIFNELLFPFVLSRPSRSWRKRRQCHWRWRTSYSHAFSFSFRHTTRRSHTGPGTATISRFRPLPIRILIIMQRLPTTLSARRRRNPDLNDQLKYTWAISFMSQPFLRGANSLAFEPYPREASATHHPMSFDSQDIRLL